MYGPGSPSSHTWSYDQPLGSLPRRWPYSVADQVPFSQPMLALLLVRGMSKPLLTANSSSTGSPGNCWNSCSLTQVWLKLRVQRPTGVSKRYRATTSIPLVVSRATLIGLT